MAVSRGRNNKLVGQAGEYLVCAQLAKRGYMATPFAGNVPVFDVLIADQNSKSLAIQVKTSSGNSWPTDSRNWMNLEFDSDSVQQRFLGPATLPDPNLILVCVSIDPVGSRDRFFILTAGNLQELIVRNHSAWMADRDWRRPRNPQSYDHRYEVTHLAPFENNWDLIRLRLEE